MKYIYFPFKPRNLPRFIGMFLLGLLIGGVATLFLQGNSYDKLYVEKKEIESYVVELQNTIERLERLQQQQTHSLIVREISVETDLSDPVKSVDVRAEAYRLLKDLIGENVDNLNPELIMSILDNRIIVVDGTQYRLNVRTVIIARKLEVYILTNQIQDGSGDE